MTATHNGWSIDESAFPADGSSIAKLQFALHYAVLAPSGHNTQPWLFRVDSDGVDVIADRRRALPVVDPDDRELTISCGAATETLLIALHYFGMGADVLAAPSAEDPDTLARVALRPEPPPDEDIAHLFHAITQRRTVRMAYEDRPLPHELLEQLGAAAGTFGVGFHAFTEAADRHRIAALVAEGDRIQFADRRFRRELAAWIHSRRAETRDGISGAAFGMPDMLSPLGSAVIRTFDIGNQVAAQDAEVAGGSPALALLTSDSDSEAAWLATGRALARNLLMLAAAGATASYLNQPVEVPELRPRLAQTAGVTGLPQLLLRCGYGPTLAPSVRRPLDEVLL